MPNLHDALHCDADILQLDVVAVGDVMDAIKPAAAGEVSAGRVPRVEVDEK